MLINRFLRFATSYREEHDDGTGGNGPGQDSMDPKRLYGEVQKLSRLLRAEREDRTKLQQQIDSLSQNQQKFKRLFAEDDPGTGDTAPTLSQRARLSHDRMRELDPESPGMPLTVDMASTLDEAKEIIAKQQERIDKLEGRYSPFAISEGSMFVALENLIEDELFNLYGNEKDATENYPDFERLAIARLKEMREKDPRKYKFFITSQKQQSDFVRNLINAKIPRSYEPKGAQAVELYGEKDALRDMKLAESEKDPRKKEDLYRRARQWALSEAASKF